MRNIPELLDRSCILGWCVDLDFYDSKVPKIQTRDNKLIVAAGKELRDYDTLVRAVKMISDPDLRVEIYCSEETAPKEADSRVSVFAGKRHQGSISYVDLLERYSAPAAIAIPLKAAGRTVGMTSLFDALAMARPILMTRHPSLDVPVEEDGMGYTIEASDISGWVKAIEQILSDPELAKEAGRRGRRYSELELSSESYSRDLNFRFEQLLGS